jgi:hypothetical protein
LQMSASNSVTVQSGPTSSQSGPPVCSRSGLMGMAAPEASRTLALAAELFPLPVTQDSAESMRSLQSSAALPQGIARKRHEAPSSSTLPKLLPSALDGAFRILFAQLVNGTFGIPILIRRSEISCLCSAPEVPAQHDHVRPSQGIENQERYRKRECHLTYMLACKGYSLAAHVSWQEGEPLLALIVVRRADG